LDFDFLDKPDGAAMTDALRQLYVLGAIDVDGEITEMGREMSPLPVEPQLARAMLEARRRGVVEEMATVAAMLSVERVFVGGSGGGKGQGQGQGQGRDGRDRDRPPPIASADETKMGDHVVLLRKYEAWARGGHRRRFCEEHGLNDRGMEFARDVRKQLLGVFRDRDRDRDMDRGNGDRDGGNGDGDGGRGGKRDRDGVEKNQTQTQRRGDVTDLRKAICVGFANKLARRLPRHNGFRTFGADASMIAEAHPSVARSLADDVTGLLPEWVVFHSLVSTTRPFIKGVCRIEPEWAAQVMPRLGDVDVGRLSGGALAEERTGANAEKAAAAAAEAEAERTREASGRKNTDQAVEDARARYLARKNKAAAKKS
jgi:ATP-dependent RNA helicase DHX8/PRP22